MEQDNTWVALLAMPIFVPRFAELALSPEKKGGKY